MIVLDQQGREPRFVVENVGGLEMLIDQRTGHSVTLCSGDRQEALRQAVWKLKKLDVYTCPVCGSNDPNLYLQCSRPDCTDGRDPR